MIIIPEEYLYATVKTNFEGSYRESKSSLLLNKEIDIPGQSPAWRERLITTITMLRAYKVFRLDPEKEQPDNIMNSVLKLANYAHANLMSICTESAIEEFFYSREMKKKEVLHSLNEYMSYLVTACQKKFESAGNHNEKKSSATFRI